MPQTGPTPNAKPRMPRRPPVRIRPITVVAVIVVLAAFLAAVWVGGTLGALVVAALAIAAGGLLVARWQALDPRIRIFRAVAVVLAAAVAISLLLR